MPRWNTPCKLSYSVASILHNTTEALLTPLRLRAAQEDSDFFSSRGSFGSLDEEYVRDSLAALGSRLPPGPLPPFGSAEASRWFDDWNASMEAHMRGRAQPPDVAPDAPNVRT